MTPEGKKSVERVLGTSGRIINTIANGEDHPYISLSCSPSSAMEALSRLSTAGIIDVPSVLRQPEPEHPVLDILGIRSFETGDTIIDFVDKHAALPNNKMSSINYA